MDVIVRADLAEAHRLAWEHLAAPGSWWTGAARLELAQTALAAIADAEPVAPWVGITSTDRLAPPQHAPAVAHDLADRLARHAATITADTYRAVTAAIGELPYVELCAIVSTVAAVAHFCRNIGAPVPPLPPPRRGDPTGVVPGLLAPARYNWVPVAAPADEVAAVQYMPNDEMVHPDWQRRPGGLSRAQMELVAARLTLMRECFY